MVFQFLSVFLLVLKSDDRNSPGLLSVKLGSFFCCCSERFVPFFLASDRLLSGRSLEDSREAMVNAVVDAFGSFNKAISQQGSFSALLSPTTMLRLFPLTVLGMLKHVGFSELNL